MKLNAYILAADPAWIEASVLSYYDRVERIVVSYDVDGRGWTGVPIDVDQCIRRLRRIDLQGKLDFRAGNFAQPEFFNRPMDGETRQRQVALSQAAEGADWVLQLDTDEVLASAPTFFDILEAADRSGRIAFNFPSIWLYAHAFGQWYLELCRRGWRRAAGYPGPLAVRSGAVLSLARRPAVPDAAYFHTDLHARKASALAFPNGLRVDRVISASEAVFHLSWVRSEAWLRRKFSAWGHAKDRNWHPEFQRWRRANRHPIAAAIFSQLTRGPDVHRLRLARAPDAVATMLRKSADDEEHFGPSIEAQSKSLPPNQSSSCRVNA